MRHPLLTCSPRREDGTIVLPARDRELVIAGDAGLLHDVLQRCDGTRTVAEVLAGVSEGERPGIVRALAELERHALLVDRSRRFRRFHDDSSLPDPLGGADSEAPPPPWRPTANGPAHGLASADAADSALGPLLGRRRSASVEQFGTAPTAAQLAELVQAAYGAVGEQRTVPSAGALSPLIVHVAALVPIGEIAPGLWWHDAAGGRLRLVARRPAAELRAPFALLPATRPLVERCAVLLLVSCDLERVAAVYGDRGYRYAWFEAGAALQNAALAAAAHDIAVRVLGGFDDAALATLLELPPTVSPFAGMAVG